MRLSIRKADRGYHPKAYGCEVYLDGNKLKNCFTADEEQGIAYCYKTDKDDRIIMNPNIGDELIEIEMYGDIKIVTFADFFK